MVNVAGDEEGTCAGTTAGLSAGATANAEALVEAEFMTRRTATIRWTNTRVFLSMEPHQHTSAPALRGYWRRTDRGRLRFSGKDALSFLQALVTNDVEALPVGGSCDAVYLTPQGRMITDMRVFRRADDVIVSVPAELAASLAERLDSLVFSEDVQIADVSSSMTHLTLIDETGNPRERVDEPPPQGAPELSAQEYELQRIERGEARWGDDMNEETIPLEAGLLERAISQTKGCYVGQEVIIRVLHRGGGRVAKRLMRITLEPGAAAPERGTPIGVDGASVGAVTSAAFSARDNRAVALGYVKREFAEPGAVVDVGSTPAVLAAAAS
jgi:folate-binding protein YgfZ